MEKEEGTTHDHETSPRAGSLHQVQRKKNDDSLNIPIAIVLAGILIAGAIILTNKNTGSETSLVAGTAPTTAQLADSAASPISVALLALRDDEHIQGNPNADVVLIEYSDLECPFCKRFHDTMVEVMDQYGKSGQVAWVYRHFPLDMHPKARKEAEAIECANELGGNNAFWNFVDKVFEITPGNNGLDPAQLPKVAGMLGLDVTKFTTCLSSGKYAPRVQRDFESGVNVGVHGTPFSIIWNRKTGKQVPVNGAYPFDMLKPLLESAITAPSTK